MITDLPLETVNIYLGCKEIRAEIREKWNTFPSQSFKHIKLFTVSIKTNNFLRKKKLKQMFHNKEFVDSQDEKILKRK